MSKLSQRKSGIVLSYTNLVAKNLVTFLYTPFLLRMLGQTEYGIYQMVNSVILSLAILDLGFGSAYIRFYARARSNKDKKSIEELNGLYMLIFIVIALISVILGVVLLFNIDRLFGKNYTGNELKTIKYLMSLMIVNIAITFPSSVFDSNIIAHEEFRFQRSRQLFQTIAAPLFTIPLLFWGMGSVSIVIIQTLITAFFFMLNVKFAIKNLGMKFKFNNLKISLLKEIFAFSFFIFLNQIIDQINWNLPNFLLGIFSGAKQVAIFAVANQIKNIFITLSTTLSGVYVPEINTIVNTTNDNEKLTQIMTKVGRLQFIILTYILGGFILLGPFFIEIWAGKEYHDAYLLSLLLVIPFLVTLIQNTGYEIVRAKNMHQFRAVIEFIFAIINVFLTIYFIKAFGVYGSVIGTMITMVTVSWIIMNWFYEKKVGLDIWYFWKNILSVTLPFVTGMILLLPMIAFFPIKNIFYFVMYGCMFSVIFFLTYWFVSANENEKKVIKQLLRR